MKLVKISISGGCNKNWTYDLYNVNLAGTPEQDKSFFNGSRSGPIYWPYYEDPYFGETNSNKILNTIDEKKLHKNFLGYKLKIVLQKN